MLPRLGRRLTAFAVGLVVVCAGIAAIGELSGVRMVDRAIARAMAERVPTSDCKSEGDLIARLVFASARFSIVRPGAAMDRLVAFLDRNSIELPAGAERFVVWRSSPREVRLFPIFQSATCRNVVATDGQARALLDALAGRS